MAKEAREHLTGWGISFGLHILLFLIIASTGLFAAVSSDSKPVDVDIYDLAEEQAQEAESEPEPEPEASAPIPEISEVVIPDPTMKEEPREEKKEREAQKEAKEGPKDAHKASEKPAREGAPKPVRDAAKEKVVAKNPILLSRGNAVYPESLRSKNAQGSVQVAFVVAADGSVQGANVVASSGYPELDAAALTAIQTFSYEPGRNGYDEPVTVRGSYTFRFHP